MKTSLSHSVSTLVTRSQAAATRQPFSHGLGPSPTRSNTTVSPRTRLGLSAALLGAASLTLGCEDPPPEPESKPLVTPREAANENKDASGASEGKEKTTKVASVPVSADDPLKGKFTLEDATEGLEGEGDLVATLKTSLGTLQCELYEDRAPITVANFVGLARGLRPFKHEGEWVKRPGYDGTSFHRIIKGFMIQGGDPKGNGTGEPGYVIPDELWPGAKHDERGLLCMANRGPNTNGMQFFITDAPAPHLDRSYTIFGKCNPDSVIEAIASHPTRGDRAIDPPKIEKVTVARKK